MFGLWSTIWREILFTREFNSATTWFRVSRSALVGVPFTLIPILFSHLCNKSCGAPYSVPNAISKKYSISGSLPVYVSCISVFCPSHSHLKVIVEIAVPSELVAAAVRV
ncbi:MAG: hypothetical protein MUO59_07930 [Actinobacteria bacterium]|nr:hypothetical protein [Actinomycetota bacterium]